MKNLVLLLAASLLFSCQKDRDDVKLSNLLSNDLQNASSNPLLVNKSVQKYKPNELLVKFTNGRPDQLSLIANNAVVVDRVLTKSMERAGYSGFHVLMVPNVEQVMNALKRNPNVEWVEPNYIYTHDAYAPTNDPSYSSLWGMPNIKAPTAWNAGNTGDQKVFIGVIDEGIMYWHEDLCGQIWTNPYETENGKDDDGNGYIDDMHGWDFMHMDNTIFDNADNHGTHVSGTIGAIGNNSKGVVGVSPNVTIISGKFLEGSGSVADAVRAVDYMTDLKTRHGMNIAATSNSWGGGGYSQALYDAINRAKNADILFVAAAGNSGNNTDVNINYPSCYNLDNIISVAAYDIGENLPAWTNYGLTTVDLGAPGVNITSTLSGTAGASTYGAYSGTSMATPHVSGAVALYKAGNPSATYAQVKAAILNSVRPIASLNGKSVTGGALNIETFTKPTVNQQVARGCVVPDIDYIAPTAPTNVQLVSKDSINRTARITWTAATDNIRVTKYVLTVDNSWYSAGYTISGDSTGITIGGVSPGAQYPSRLVAYDAWNNPSPVASYTIILGYDVTPPSTPGNFRVVTYDATSVTFGYDWSKDDWSGIGLYRISYRVASCNTCTWRGWHTNNVNPLAVPNLATNTQYAFTIAAMDNNRNWSPESPVILETPRSGPDITPPNAPTGLNSTATSSSITPYWTATTDNVGVVGYDVYYKLSSASTFSLYGSTTNTQLTIAGLQSATSYDIYVVAKDAAGNTSTPSATITRSTQAGPDVNSPTAPSNLTATSTTSSISASWGASTDNVGVAGYNVFYKLSSASTYTLYTKTINTSMLISGLSSGTSYDVYITAYDAAGNTSIASNVVTISTVPISTTVSNRISGQIKNKTSHIISWTVTTNGVVVRNMLQRAPVGGVFSDFSLLSNNLSGSIGFTVPSGTTYSYRLVTSLSNNVSAISNSVTLKSR